MIEIVCEQEKKSCREIDTSQFKMFATIQAFPLAFISCMIHGVEQVVNISFVGQCVFSCKNRISSQIFAQINPLFSFYRYKTSTILKENKIIVCMINTSKWKMKIHFNDEIESHNSLTGMAVEEYIVLASTRAIDLIKCLHFHY